MGLIEGHRPIQSPHNIPTWDIDPYDEAILADPYDFWADLREKGDLVYIPRYEVLAVGRYETTKKTFSDHITFVSSRGVGLNDFKLEKPWRPPSIILEVDPPDHKKTRTVMSRALSPKVVKNLAESFRATAEQLIDHLLKKETIDGVLDLAETFPATVFPQAVGLKDVHTRNLIDYGAIVFNAVGPDNALRKAAMARAPEVAAWITAACARDHLTRDGMGEMIYTFADNGDITLQEAAMLVRSLLSAGVDTTVTGIGNALWCFAHNPDQWDLLKENPKLARPAFEEVLRYTSPVHSFARTANVDTNIAGFPVAEGTKILCFLGAANMDPHHWDEPNAFRIERKTFGHLAFGTGIHGCVGQNIARGELEAVLTVMAEKIDRIELVGDAVWRPNNAIHSLDRLPLRLIPK